MKRYLLEESRPIKIIVFILILIFYGTFLVHKIKLPVADDLARHIKNGEMIIKGNFDVLHYNFYSYTEPKQPFTNHHWLSGVIFYLLYSAIGFKGLVIFKTAVLLTAFSLLFKVSIKKADFWLASFLSVPTILLMSDRTGVRPEIFSFLFISIFFYMLFNLEENPRKNRIFWLLPLQVMWVNMHLFWGVGILLTGGFLFEKIVLNFRNLWHSLLIKKLILLLLILIAVSFINPHGIKFTLYLVDVHFLGDFPISISEEQSFSDFLKTELKSEYVAIATFIPAIMVLAISFIFNWKRKPIFYLLASMATIKLSFSIISRGLPLFALIFLPSVSGNFNDLFNKIRAWILNKNTRLSNALGICMVAILIMVLSVLIFIGNSGKIYKYKNSGIGLVRFSDGPANFFKEQELKGPIFNNIDIGSYLIFHLFPTEKVFTDNRFGDAYSYSFFKNIYLPTITNEKTWEETARRYDFNVIFFYHYEATPGARQFLYRRMNDPTWSLVYADSYAVVLVKNIEENKNVVENFKITKENIKEKLNYLLESKNPEHPIAAGDLFTLMNRDDLTMETFKEVVKKWPERAGRMLMIMGEIESKKDDLNSSVSAMFYLQDAIKAGQKTAEAYSFLGLAYYRLGQREKSVEALEKALEINPQRMDAKQMLEIINKTQE